MNLDLHRQRRNLVGVSLGLVVFETAGGTVGEVSFLDGGVTLSNPELVIVSAYIALAYLLWRYWLYAKPEHQRFRELVADTILNSSRYHRLVGDHISRFKEISGVAHAEEFNGASIDKEEATKLVPIPLDASIHRSLFRCKLVIRVDNPKGDYKPDHESYKIPFFHYEAVSLKGWLSVVAGNRVFSDLYVPYMSAFLAIGLHCFWAIYA